MVGTLAISKSGHDKGRIYVIVAEEGSRVLLADGELRGIGNPKKKNIRHIQPILHLPPETAELLKDMAAITDLEIKRALKIYRRNQEDMNVESRCH